MEEDWAALEHEYVTTDISVAEMSTKYGISRRTTEKVCTRNGWVAKRDEYKRTTAAQAVRITSEQAAEKMQIFYGISDKLNALVATYSDIMGRTDDLKSASDAGKRQSCRELSELAKAARGSMDLARELYGVPSQAEAERQRVARERLQIEKERAAREAQAAEHGAEPVVIRIEGADDFGG